MERVVVVYELDDMRKEVFALDNDPEAERHERASAEREKQNPQSHIVSFHFEWRKDVPGHSWYE